MHLTVVPNASDERAEPSAMIRHSTRLVGLRRSLARCPFCKSRASCLGAACAFHQKGAVSRGEQTARQSAPRAVKSHIACSAFVTRCIEAMLRASWRKTVGCSNRNIYREQMTGARPDRRARAKALLT